MAVSGAIYKYIKFKILLKINSALKTTLVDLSKHLFGNGIKFGIEKERETNF